MVTVKQPLHDEDENSTMLRPISRLPNQRPEDEGKEVMNCKNCRKRKIKCNRLKPRCGACAAFKCPCIYDAVPKKRGPKTDDVLKSLVKRVNGLEQRVKDGQPSPLPTESELVSGSQTLPDEPDSAMSHQPSGHHMLDREVIPDSMPDEPQPPRPSSSFMVTPDIILDVYFARLSEKPYYILDEKATRQRLLCGRLPPFLVHALYAVAIRFAAPVSTGYEDGLQASREYARRSRANIDVDEPSIEYLQALLLLAIANFQTGQGRKAYMNLSHAITMAFALDLHRELPSHLQIPQDEREGRRKLFWTCFLMDRFSAAGSRRPLLISDETIRLRIPTSRNSPAQIWDNENAFQSNFGLTMGQTLHGSIEGSDAILIRVVRILGVATRYISLGGLKIDPHFPWNSQSQLSKIRADLDVWTAASEAAFVSLETRFHQPEGLNLLLSKLIYHLIHCLIYRPLLPITLDDISGSSVQQNWQVEAMKLAFVHATAIVKLVESAKSASVTDWAPFVGFCIYTAGTIHVHGAYYGDRSTGHIFGNSKECLSREMEQLDGLRWSWVGVEHERETLHTIHATHRQLVQSVSCGSVRLPSIFQMDNFLDRYTSLSIDEAHVPFVQGGSKQTRGNEWVGHHRSSVSTSTLLPAFEAVNERFLDSYPSPTSASTYGPTQNVEAFAVATNSDYSTIPTATSSYDPQFHALQQVNSATLGSHSGSGDGDSDSFPMSGTEAPQLHLVSSEGDEQDYGHHEPFYDLPHETQPSPDPFLSLLEDMAARENYAMGDQETAAMNSGGGWDCLNHREGLHGHGNFPSWQRNSPNSACMGERG